MYRVTIPLNNSHVKRNGRERVAEELHRMDAHRVLLALERDAIDHKPRREALTELADNCRFFHEQGFEVGSWCWTFWQKTNRSFRKMRSIQGTEIGEYLCPSDEGFVDFFCGYIQDIARCGVDLIQFDDDFRYGFLVESPGCLCDGHMAEIQRILGRPVSREELCAHILSGEPNPERDAYIQANGAIFRRFAAALRAALDEIDPCIRMGACSCMTSWDIDGINPRELATVLAGGTKPFTRQIGAPYWAVEHHWGNRLQDVVELERMESAWTGRADIEILAEGDAFPRPRHNCPASYLEGFDTALRVAGCVDGILKYGIDYTSNADYETGYASFHERNRPLYEALHTHFDGKTSVGVRVYESAEKLSAMVMPTRANSEVNIQNLFFSKAARTLSHNAIPTVYEGDGVCGIVFDENARHLPADALKKGLILDIAAAEILTEQGVDVGLLSICDAVSDGQEEHFLADGNHIAAQNALIYDLRLNPRAEVLSDIATSRGILPVSYRYENAAGNRFLVLNLNTRVDSDNLLKHYARGRQYATQIPWLSGEALPAYCYGHPALYLQCKEDAHSLSVGLWNFFADIAMEPVVELAQSYESIRFIQCDGRLERNRVVLTDIPAFGFAGFTVENPLPR